MTETRPCGVCGEDVLGRDFVQVDGAILFVLRGDRDEPEYLAREDHCEERAEYFCRGCFPAFEEMMWVQIDNGRSNAR